MSIKFPKLSTTKNRVQAALALFKTNDLYLLKKDLNERAIAHKFAEALQTVFRSWHVDCEYNRNGLDPKRVEWPHPPSSEELTKLVVPDIIIHRRGSSNNLLAIEVKKSSNVTPENRENDTAKLQAYIDQLDYRYSLFITFNTNETVARANASGSDYYKLRWFPI